MSTLEINKIVGAILLALICVWVIGMLGDALVDRSGQKHEVVAKTGAPEAIPKSGAPAAEAESKAPVTKGPVVKEPVVKELEPVSPLLAKADAEQGKKIARKCTACHDLKKGGKDKIGPALWGIVGATIGGRGGFSYSKGLKNKGGSWGYENLNAFIAKPKTFIPGTKMTFNGLKKARERADLVAYLRSLSDSPAPLP